MAELEDKQRSAPDVVGRIFGLRAVLWRAQLELAARKDNPPPDSGLRTEQLNLWVSTSKVPVSKRERELLDRRLGGWEMPEIGELLWRNEAAFVLLWAIEQVEMPSYTTVVPATLVFDHVERLFRPPAAPRLRPAADIRRAFEVAEFWNWRARNEMFRRQGMPAPPQDSYEATVDRATRHAQKEGFVEPAAVVAGDLVVAGTRYTDLDQKTFVEISCIAHERHWALNWLIHVYEWDEALPST